MMEESTKEAFSSTKKRVMESLSGLMEEYSTVSGRMVSNMAKEHTQTHKERHAQAYGSKVDELSKAATNDLLTVSYHR